MPYHLTIAVLFVSCPLSTHSCGPPGSPSVEIQGLILDVVFYHQILYSEAALLYSYVNSTPLSFSMQAVYGWHGQVSMFLGVVSSAIGASYARQAWSVTVRDSALVLPMLWQGWCHIAFISKWCFLFWLFAVCSICALFLIIIHRRSIAGFRKYSCHAIASSVGSRQSTGRSHTQ